MVIIYWLMLMMGMLPLFSEVRVQAEADQVDHFENLPIPVTIMITHPPDLVVDEGTFLLGKDAIRVAKVKDVGDAGGKADILTIYHYDLPNKPKGLHVLPSITVKIGGKAYKSVASTFAVKGMEGSEPTPLSIPSSSGGVFLRLENIISGPTTLFPGQTTILGYRYSFNANIETTEEITPLFAPKGFLKVGDKIVNKKETADTSILEVTQQLQAQEPGVYKIGPSTIEGYVYSEDSQGKRKYAKDKLKSVAAAVIITVKPLPAEDKPASFNGAIGKYTFKVLLKTPPKVTVGDEMTLQIEVSGSGDLDTVQLPELCCQPGMSGVFKLSDLPPVGKIEGRTKRFSVDLRPLSAAVSAIPSLEFSYFDPDAQKFETLHSSPIPIQVLELKPGEEDKPAPDAEKPKEKDVWQQPFNQPSAIEVEGNYPLTSEDLQDRWFSSWWTLLLLPLALALLIYQANLKGFLDSRKIEIPIATSTDLFNKAWEEPPHSSAFYAQLYQAFYTRLQERGDIDPSTHSIDKLPSEGAAGDVKALLTSIEEARYAGDQGVKEKRLLEQARKLFKELEDRP